MTRTSVSGILPASLAYFLVVFGCGFALGIVRTLWLVPRLGERWAELLEMPIMLTVIVLAARWVVRRFRLGEPSHGARLAVGLLALALLLAAELALVLAQGFTLGDYLASRDPVSGTAYALSLLLFAGMPALVGSRRTTSRS